jgi:hypothetical protein
MTRARRRRTMTAALEIPSTPVAAARGRIIGDASAPQIVIAVTASQAADLHALHHRIETEALAHARQAIGRADLAIQLDLGVSRRTA